MNRRVRPRAARRAMALIVLAWALVQGAEPRPPAPEDPELLEFLGSSDPSADSSADDGTWIEYLSRTDIGRVARNAPPRSVPEGAQGPDDRPPAAASPGASQRYD